MEKMLLLFAFKLLLCGLESVIAGDSDITYPLACWGTFRVNGAMGSKSRQLWWSWLTVLIEEVLVSLGLSEQVLGRRSYTSIDFRQMHLRIVSVIIELIDTNK